MSSKNKEKWRIIFLWGEYYNTSTEKFILKEVKCKAQIIKENQA